MISINLVKVVIPYRYASNRLPGKSLLEIRGQPIFWHVYQRVLEAGVSEENIIIATDDARIYKKAEELSLNVVMTSIEHSSGTDRINEVANIYNWDDETLVVNVQGDEPFIPASLIMSLINYTINNSQFDITTVVVSIQSAEEMTNPNDVKTILGTNGQALYFSRAAAPYNRTNPTDFSQAYRHIGIYAYKKLTLLKICNLPETLLEDYEKLEQLRALSHGMSIGAVTVKTPRPHGIDTMEDYQKILNLKR